MILMMIDADGGAEGVHALQRLRQEGPQAHLQDGRYTHLSIAIISLDRSSTAMQECLH